ncbi:hypothetical protein SAMN05444716_10719 [Streptomyces harbinensis]|uniref:Uncharacterized protein n=1 Tax=Streptomyces harbinensis TaxID=1176198 RepID=A0A1I6V2P7_9ACTN|nr:hypothetical protein SAMN05444716_10719 [Streptomyces harbinensis]
MQGVGQPGCPTPCKTLRTRHGLRSRGHPYLGRAATTVREPGRTGQQEGFEQFPGCLCGDCHVRQLRATDPPSQPVGQVAVGFPRECGTISLSLLLAAVGYRANGGVLPDDLAAAVEPLVAGLRVESLSGHPDLRGRPVDDIRYALIGRL